MNDQMMIRVVIADDSAFIRRYLVELFRTDPMIEVVGVASDGDEAIHLAKETHPDVVTMDYHMPKKNGLEAAAAIMLGDRPLPGIVILSAFEGEEGQEVRRTLEACGATVVAKPSGEISLDIEKISSNILAQVRSVGLMNRNLRSGVPTVFAPVPTEDECTDISRVVVIGASTGGPPLVEHLLSSLNPTLGISVVIVQHMSKYFTEIFAERLDRVTQFVVSEAKSGDLLLPGHALVVPGGTSLTCNRNEHTGTHSLSVVVLPTDGYHEVAIDRTMESIADVLGTKVVGILLSGMGTDGTAGLKRIEECGGETIVQDPKTATIASMPMNALREFDVDQVLPVEGMADYLMTKVMGRE